MELSDQPDAPVLVQKDPTAQEAQSDHLAATGWAVHQVAMGYVEHREPVAALVDRVAEECSDPPAWVQLIREYDSCKPAFPRRDPTIQR